MKKLRKLIAAAFMICVLTCAVFAENINSSVTVTLDGELVDCAFYGQEAVIVDGRTLVPLRAIFEALGATVEWNNELRTVTSTLDDVTISLKIGENILYRNNEEVTIDVPAMIMNNRTLVPARAVAESFGVDVEWDAAKRCVILTRPALYEKGTVSGNVYTSKWLGIKLVFPDGFFAVSERQLKDIMGIVGDATLENVDEESALSMYEFFAITGDGKNISLAVERNTKGFSASEYLKLGFDAAVGDMKLNYGVTNNYEFKIGANTFEGADAVLGTGEKESLVSLAVTQKDDFFVTLLLYGFDEEERLRLLSCFEEIDTETRVHAYGKFRFGMSMKELLEKVQSSDVAEYETQLVIYDDNGIFSDEDAAVTCNLNCNVMKFYFENGVMNKMQLTTDRCTEQQAADVLENMIQYYGQPLKSGLENKSCYWELENKVSITAEILKAEDMLVTQLPSWYLSLELEFKA